FFHLALHLRFCQYGLRRVARLQEKVSRLILRRAFGARTMSPMRKLLLWWAITWALAAAALASGLAPAGPLLGCFDCGTSFGIEPQFNRFDVLNPVMIAAATAVSLAIYKMFWRRHRPEEPDEQS